MTRTQQYIVLAVLTLGTMAVMAVGLAIVASMISAPAAPAATTSPEGFTPLESEPATALNPTGIPASPLPEMLASVTLLPTMTASPLPLEPTAQPDTTAWVEQHLASLTLSDKIGQMIMMGVSGQASSDYTCSLILDISPGSVVYVGDNVVSPEQLRQFSAALQDCNSHTPAGIPLWVAMDHEGQYVYRYDTQATIFPAAMAFGAADDLDLAFQAALRGGGELAYSGVNMVLGPDADLLTNYDNDVISVRSFGGDPLRVSAMVASATRGYQAAGLVPVLKHFPGHGGVAADSHYSLPVDQASLESLRSSYLPPFQSGISAGAQVVMFSHVSFPAVDPSGLPASLSPVINDLLRQELGFNGVILTDSLGMGAITGETSIPEASLQAVRSGTDMLLITSPEIALQTRDRLVNAVQSGELSQAQVDAAVRRILTVKALNGQTGYPLPQVSAPDWTSNASLAYQAGYQAVTVLRDDGGWIPLPGSRVLLTGPADAWGLYPVLQSALQEHGYTVDIYPFSGPWNGAVVETGYLSTLPAYAASYDVSVVLTWQSHLNQLLYGDYFQANLVNNLLNSGRPVVVAALKSPVDVLDFPTAPTYLSTFGTTAGQLDALADILTGETEASGANPLPGLP